MVLEKLSAKRAQDLINDPGKINNPFLTDMELLFASGGLQDTPLQDEEQILLRSTKQVLTWDKKQVLRQPFLSQWIRIYEIAWEEHKDASHSDCSCCLVFGRIPPQLRRQSFSIEVLKKYLDLRPSVDEVQDLMSKR